MKKSELRDSTIMRAIDVQFKLDQEINDFLGEERDITTPCNINGVSVSLTETQVRWLQVKAYRAYKDGGQEAFDEFVQNNKVFAITRDGQRVYQMKFQTNGLFENEFERPFFNVNSLLVFEIFEPNIV